MGARSQFVEDAALPVFSPAFRRDLEVLTHSQRGMGRFETTRVPERFVARVIRASAAPGPVEPTRLVRLGSNAARKAVLENFEDANALVLAASPTDPRTRAARLARAALRDAPVQFAVFHDGGPRIAMHPDARRNLVAGGIARMSLCARALGFATGEVAVFDPHLIARDLAVPADWSFVACFCLGYSADEHIDLMDEEVRRRTRQSLPDDVLHR